MHSYGISAQFIVLIAFTKSGKIYFHERSDGKANVLWRHKITADKGRRFLGGIIGIDNLNGLEWAMA